METSITSLMYVSDSLLDSSIREEEVEKILAVAVDRNAASGLTGALVFTGTHFAQVLEGSAAAVDEVMSRICADRRHTNVDIVEIVEIDRRRFPGWSMAYSGPSLYVDRLIRPVIKQVSEGGTRMVATRSLMQLMLACTAAGGVDHFR